MTHNFYAPTLNWAVAQKTEQERVAQYVKRVFGCEPDPVRIPRSGYGPQGICFARVRFGVGSPVELIVANGLLLAIPPKESWK